MKPAAIFKKICTMVLLSVMIMGTAGCAGTVSDEGDGTVTISGDSQNYTAGGGNVSAAIDKIEIEWVSGEVNISSGNVQEISFYEESSKEQDENHSLHYTIDGGTLKIKYSKPGKTIHISDGDKKLFVTVPEKINLKELDIENVSSEVKVDFSGLLREFSVETVSGNVTAVLDNAADEVSIDSVSADVKLRIPDVGFSMEFEGVSGDFSSDFDVEIRGDFFIHGSGEKSFEADTVSGNVAVNRI